MRINTQTIQKLQKMFSSTLVVSDKAKSVIKLGLTGQQWIASFVICLMLMPIFSIPVGATVIVAATDPDIAQFERVNAELPIWETLPRNLSAKYEEWTTPMREVNVLHDGDEKNKKTIDEKEGTKRKGKKGEESFEEIDNKSDAQTLSDVKIMGPISAEKKIDVEHLDDESIDHKTKPDVSALTESEITVSNTSSRFQETGRSAEEIASLFNPQNNLGSPYGQVEAQAPNSAAAMRRSLERPGSSNFSFGVPIASLPGRGIDAGINLSYNSRVWNKNLLPIGSNYVYRYNTDGNWIAPGFNLSLGMLERLGYYNYSYTSPDGTRYQFSFVSGDHFARTYETTDGSFMKLDTTHSSTGNNDTTSAVIKSSGGQVINFLPLSLSKLFPVKMTEKNGNYIEITYKANDAQGRISKIKDTLGRFINFHYDSSDRLVAVTVPGYNNSSERQTVRFYYESMNFPTADRFANANEVMPTNVDVLKYLYFPGTQTGYKYEYSPGYGMINKVSDLRTMQVSSTDLNVTGSVTSEGQTAASTTYNYPLTVGAPLADVPKYTIRTDDWAGRTTPQPAETTYQTTIEGGFTKSSIISPDGTITESWAKSAPGSWDDGLITDTFVKTLISPQFQSYKIWSHTKNFWLEGQQSNTSGRKNPRIIKVEETNDAGQTRATTYGHDNYNNETLKKEHDFASPGQLGAELERTEITYEIGSGWIDNRIYSLPKTVKNIANNVTVSRTDFDYDNYGVSEANMTPRNDIIMHDPTFNPSSSSYNSNTKFRGNITKVRSFSNAALENDLNASIENVKYDIAGNEVEATANCCVKFTWGFDKLSEYAYQTTELRGLNSELTSSTVYDFNTGLVETTSNENNQETFFTYDVNNLRQIRVDRPDGGYSTFEYHDGLVTGPNNRKWSYIKSTTKVDATKEVSDWNYLDGRGASVRKLGPLFNGEHQGVIDIEYDSTGRATRKSNPYLVPSFSSTINPSNNWTMPTFDPLGRAILVTLPDGNTIQRQYDGTTVLATDQAGKQRRQIFNALGNVTRTDEPDVNGTLGSIANPLQPTLYEYDGNDNLTKVTQTGDGATQVRLFKYDSLSRLTHEKKVEAIPTLNDNGVKIGIGGQWTGVYKYDASSLLVDGADARGVKTSFTYDTLNRVKTVNFTGETGYQTPNITYTYDEERTGFFNKSQLTKVETAQIGTEQTATAHILDYDIQGKIKKHTQSIGSESYVLEYGYNLAGQLISEKYPSGRTVNLEVDTIGRVSTISDAQRTYASSVQFAAHGAVNSMAFGNGTTQTFGYDLPRLQLTSQSLTKGSEILQKFEYAYGKVDLVTGNLDANMNNGQLARVDAYVGGTISNPTKQWQQRFDYDSVGRLIEAREHRGDTNALSYRQKFDFDRFGNLYRKNASNPTSGQETPLGFTKIEDTDIDKNTNQFKSATGITYNDAGQVETDNKFRLSSFNYDANGRMVKAVRANIPDALSVYDALGNRVATKVNDTWQFLIYDAFGKLVAEYGGTQSSDEGGVKYILRDRQGSSRAVLSNSGYIQSRMDYTAFGEVIGANVGLRTSAQGFGADIKLKNKYALTERDEATGLDHTWFRKLENQAGRWTSPDPYNGSMALDNPQSFNRFSYVGNDPINFVDPSGLIKLPEGRWDGWWSGEFYRFFSDRSKAGGSRGGGSGHRGGGGSAASSDEKEYKRCVSAIRNKYVKEPKASKEKQAEYELDKKQTLETLELDASQTSSGVTDSALGAIFGGAVGALGGGTRAGIWGGIIGGLAGAAYGAYRGKSNLNDRSELALKQLGERNPEAAALEFFKFAAANVDNEISYYCDKNLEN